MIAAKIPLIAVGITTETAVCQGVAPQPRLAARRWLGTALMEAELAETGGVSPRVSPFADLRDAAGLLQRAGFALPVADADTVTATYGDFFALLRDLRGRGETNLLLDRLKHPTRRTVFARAAAIYQERFANREGRLPATFQVLFLTGWAPDPSQQQPARRGSGQTNLKDVFRP